MTRDQIATVLRALNDECGRLNDLHGVHPTDEQWGVVRDVLRAYHAVGKIRAEEAQPARVEAPLERLASLVRLAALGRAILARLPAPPLDGSEHVDLVVHAPALAARPATDENLYIRPATVFIDNATEGLGDADDE